MKKIIIGVLILTASCASMPNIPINLGIFNPENLPEEELVTLTIHSYIQVQQVNDIKVDWSGDKNRKKNQIVKIPSGLQTFQVTFRDGGRFTLVPMPVGAQFEKGNSYLLISTEVEREVEFYGQKIKQKQVEYHIYLFNEGIQGEEVSINQNKLQQTGITAQLAYTQFVHDPISREGKSILMINESYILLLRPDNVFKLQNIKTGTDIEGRYIYPTGWRAVTGKVFLYELDISTMSREKFLSSDNIQNYIQNSQMILIPIKCTSNEVVFRYERPNELEGTEIRFLIRYLNQSTISP